MKDLPIGISTFRDIIEGNFLYIDKTKYIYDMIRPAKGYYFLSRPRRFGKSLLVSTLDEIFSGNKELFKGLWIYNSNYKWDKYPVIRIDMSNTKIKTASELEKRLLKMVNNTGKKFDIKIEDDVYYGAFGELIEKIAEKSEKKKVVILIDEYDKPIIDNITNTKEVIGIRDILKGFYGVMKAEDRYIRFVFMTGVSKFSKAGVFSELNNLDDITMSNRFSTMLGITQEELKKYFAKHINAVAKKMGISKEEVIKGLKEWYDGYCFSEESKRVYNPFSTMKFFKEAKYSNYWFETGTPRFLIDLIKERDYDLTEIPAEVDSMAFSTYEVEDLEILPLLFQRGYLTITKYNEKRQSYTLDYPNKEVKQSFTKAIFKAITGRNDVKGIIDVIREKIEANDIEGMMEEIKYVLMNLPYPIREGRHRYYQSVVGFVFFFFG